MARSKKTTAMAVAAGVVTLGAGLGVATLASADPTATPSAAPSAPSQSAAPDAPGGPGGHRGPGERGPRADELAKSLADKLDVTQAEVTDALQKFREDNKPTAKASPGTDKPDPAVREEALAKSLAGSLGVDEAKVRTALAEIRSAGQADRAAALKTRLDTAVKGGTLTQAEADAVTKAVDEGVINVGPR